MRTLLLALLIGAARGEEPPAAGQSAAGAPADLVIKPFHWPSAAVAAAAAADQGSQQAAASQATLRLLKADEVGTTHTHGTEPMLVEFILSTPVKLSMYFTSFCSKFITEIMFYYYQSGINKSIFFY